MRRSLVRVCVTGPESTGKTTLARRLGEWAGVSWVPEAARGYAERQGRELTADDVGPIAREHIELADAASLSAGDDGLILLDQDLLSTVVYGRHYYGTVPRWVEREERARRAHLYLLCDVDVPWIPDGVRDRPTDREAMFGLFQEALERRLASVVVVRGGWEERWETARDAVAGVIARIPRAR